MRFLVPVALVLSLFVFSIDALADEPHQLSSVPAALVPGGAINCASTYYPQSAIVADETGEVAVTVAIDETGKATKVTVDKSSGFADLDEATIRCVSKFAFTPASQNGVQVASFKQYKITYHLSDEWIPENRSGFPTRCENSSEFPNDVPNGTLLVFRVTQEGGVKNLFVASSSGNTAFDDAAIRCASKWTYRPARVNNHAKEVPWASEIIWMEHLGLTNLEGTHFNHAAVCSDSWYPPTAAQAKIEGVTDLSFTITTHGVPVDVNIDKSSGNTSLDAAAVACAQSWRYTESKFNSPGFREPWGVQIIWKGGHVFVVQVPK